MKLAVMQPYFFPYLGYFQLVEAADRFILADEVQYIRHGWVNRNRVQKENGECTYIIAPVQKHSLKTPIKNIEVVPGKCWKKEILKKLESYKSKAPFYKQVYSFVQGCFEFESVSITLLNQHFLTQTCRYIGIEKEIELQSELDVDYSKVENKTDRVLQLCFQLGADTYINLPGGTALYDKNFFSSNGIDLKFIKPNLRPYQQFSATFEPALSIIDVMMFNEPGKIKEMVKDYQLL